VKNTFTIVPGLEQVNLPEGLSVEDAIEQYLSDPNVEYAEPNYLRYASSISPRIPNDTYFARQWSLMNTGIIADGTPGADIQATDAWGINTGSSSVPIAVIDTGIDYDHPDLVGNIWINPLENPNNGIDDDGNGKVDDWRGWDFTTCAAFRSGPPFDCVTPKSEDNDPFDDEGHGTHVSGTVGAVGNNGEGVTGVMWQAQLMALKALNAQGVGSTADIINAVDYAVANGALIMNASLGGSGFSQAMFDALSAANTAGVLLVAAAGNESANNDLNPHYPASYNLSNIISVAATDQNDRRISFSNFGPDSVDVAAPGVYIFSTVPTWWDTAGFGILEFFSGTSMATPHVAGLAGLLYSQYPHFTHAQVRGTIMRYVDVLPSLQGWIASGGRINAYMAISSLLAPAGLDATATSQSEISLMWKDNAMAEDGYKVERSTSGGPFVEIADLSPDSESYVDGTNVFPANTYTYRVMAYNSIPAYSSMVTAVVPAAPTNLSAVNVSAGRIDLSWSDNSTNETSFEIERNKISTTVTDIEREEGFTLIATVGPNVTSYSDTNLLAATYVYRVRAVTGTATGRSAYSNEASAEAFLSRSGGGGCSIGSRQNTPTALAGIAVLLLPLLFIALMRRKGQERD
jgi:subtilisin family serine protease